jgi:putative N-acetyltransferase (TIGR04045 family)
MYCVEMGLADSRDTYRPAEYWIKWAQLPWEIDEAYKLRRAVFCIEQGIFVGDDRDDIDRHAQLLVAVSCCAGLPEQVVGTVRFMKPCPARGWGRGSRCIRRFAGRAGSARC